MHNSARVLPLALALCAACGVEQLWQRVAPGEAAVGPSAPSTATPGECDAEVVPGAPFELPSGLDVPALPDAAAPAEPPLLRLDLSPGRAHTYLSETRLDPGDPAARLLGETRRETVRLVGQGGGLGRYVVHGPPPPGFPEAGTGDMLQGLVVDVGEDTRIRGRAAQELELQMRFPLPPAPLQPGVAIARPVRLPVDSFNTLFYARGLMTFALDKYTTVDGHRAVQYRVKLDIHDVDAPPEARNPPKIAVEYHAVAVFDLDDRSFVSVTSVAREQIDMFPGEDMPEDLEEMRDFGKTASTTRRTLTRDRARTTPLKDAAPPRPVSRCGPEFGPGEPFEVPAELAISDWPAAPAPAEPPLLRWDLAGTKVHRLVGQRVDPTPNPFKAGSTETVTRLDLQIHSADGRARYVGYEEMTGLESPSPGAAAEPPTPTVVTDIDAESRVSGRVSQEADLRLRFPIPPAPLVAGRPIATPFEFPFSVMAAMFYARGTLTFALEDHVTVDGHPGVRYRVRATVDRVDAPPEVAAAPTLKFEYHAVAVFDTVAGAVVAVESRTKQYVDMTAPLTRAGEPPPPADMAVSDTTLRTSLRRPAAAH